MGDSSSELDRGARFMRLYLDHQRRIYGLILALVPHGSDADDILQEASSVMWQKFDEFDPGTNFSAWALRVARFQVMAYYTRKQRNRARFSDETLDAVVERMAARADRPDVRSDVLDGCLARLPDRERDLLQLRYRGEATVEEIARRSGRTVSAVYKALNVLHERLLECLQRKLEAENAG